MIRGIRRSSRGIRGHDITISDNTCGKRIYSVASHGQLFLVSRTPMQSQEPPMHVGIRDTAQFDVTSHGRGSVGVTL
jgi:hypothetical protein